MKTKKTIKKFNLEKFEVVKLSSMRKIVGGMGGDGTENTSGGDVTITDLITVLKTK